jgi:hypothetical protein
MPLLPYCEDGIPLLDIALVMNFYFIDGFKHEVRERVIACLEEYNRIAGSHLHHWTCVIGDGKGRWKRFKSDAIQSTARAVLEDNGLPVHFIFTGGEQLETATPFEIDCYLTPAWEEKQWQAQSFISFHLPWTWFADNEGDFPSFFHKIASTLQPRHGFGGVGFALSAGLNRAIKMSPAVYRLAQAQPFLIVENGAFDANYMFHGIREGNFLTALDDEWAGRLGGIDAIENALGPEFIIRRYRHGLTIQAGTEPNPGGTSIYQPIPDVKLDPSKAVDPLPIPNAAKRYPLYHRLNQVLKPIRVSPDKFPDTLQYDSPDPTAFFDRAKTIAWMKRFD